MGILNDLDYTKPESPGEADELTLYLEWLEFQRRTFVRKCRDLTPDQLSEMPIEGLNLSIHGLIRHMTQMEHAGISRGLGGGNLHFAYSTDEAPEADFDDVQAATIELDLAAYQDEVARADEAIAALQGLDDIGLGHGLSLRWTFVKMIQEYAVHNGQAHVLRFAVKGDTRAIG